MVAEHHVGDVPLRVVRLVIRPKAPLTSVAQPAGIEAEVSEFREEESAVRALERERAELLARERSARNEAQAATCARDEFLATLSHELRTPLNAILGWARLIAGGNLDQPTLLRAIAIIERNARNEVQLVDDLLDMSRLVSGSIKLDLQTASVAALIDSAADSIRPACGAKNILLTVEVSGTPDQMICDARRVQQILWNLLSNAVKFTPQGGQISVTAEESKGCLSIAVQDTGVGIKPEFLPLVFDRFRQQDRATTRAQGGLGIGLAVAKHLAELHGGDVSVSSEGEGSGSTFTLTLPLLDATCQSMS